jgi:hypothetical protein
MCRKRQANNQATCIYCLFVIDKLCARIHRKENDQDELRWEFPGTQTILEGKQLWKVTYSIIKVVPHELPS